MAWMKAKKTKIIQPSCISREVHIYFQVLVQFLVTCGATFEQDLETPARAQVTGHFVIRQDLWSAWCLDCFITLRS